ncbi:MAG: 50S ribosomal protein L21e [Methanomassiliicoccales archaeon]|nr:MAG: 50S ribosomal protein L21e [Methanomassiliicoccales archaeon]
MIKASKGLRRRTRQKFRRRARERGLSPITRSFVEYEEGEKANIVIDPSIQKGQPHSRFHGQTGTVIGNQGRAYLLEVKMGRKIKRVIVNPEHLRKAK